MKTAILFGLALSFAAAGCDRGDGAARPQDKTGVANAPADNTKKNERDRSPSALTPTDQGESEADRTITQQIRQEVVKDSSLSTTAKNVKIITINGVVTLRGPVKTDQERADIASLAQHLDGVKRVDNQLEIAAN